MVEVVHSVMTGHYCCTEIRNSHILEHALDIGSNNSTSRQVQSILTRLECPWCFCNGGAHLHSLFTHRYACAVELQILCSKTFAFHIICDVCFGDLSVAGGDRISLPHQREPHMKTVIPFGLRERNAGVGVHWMHADYMF